MIKMLVFNVVMLCCAFIFHRENNESEALIIYDPRYRYYSYNNLAGRGSYGNYYYDQQRYSFNSPTKSDKKPSHKHKSKSRSQPPIDLSFEPLGALKIDSLTHGQIEINPDKIDDVLLSLASGTLSMIPDFYQYIPGIPFFNGDDEPTSPSSENQSADESSPPKKHRNRNSDQDDSEENNDEKDNSDDSKHNHKDAENDDDDDNAAEEHDASDANADKSKEKKDSSEEKNNSKEETDEKSKDSSKPSKESASKMGTEVPIEGLPTKDSKEKQVDELALEAAEGAMDTLPAQEGTEIPIEGLPAQEGYVDTFVRYYSYAKPIAKAASLFVPGIGQYRAVMLGVEVADLAYNVASMYKNGDGYLSMGYFLGKEAFKRLGRRNEPLLESQVSSSTIKSHTDLENFLNEVTSLQYPFLDEEKEQQIKTAVTNIVYKYCHDQEQYQNETERAEFINLMISCVKFIAFHEIMPEISEKPDAQTDEQSSV